MRSGNRLWGTKHSGGGSIRRAVSALIALLLVLGVAISTTQLASAEPGDGTVVTDTNGGKDGAGEAGTGEEGDSGQERSPSEDEADPNAEEPTEEPAPAKPRGIMPMALGDFAWGVVIVDADKNGTLDSTGAPGKVDQGVAGVTVTVIDSTGAEVASTTTAADGSWAIPAEPADATGPYTVRIDAAGVNGNAYATHTATSADNDFARSGGAQKAAAAPSAAPGELNALIYPTWALDLALAGDPEGLGGKAIRTGTGPFDANDSEPGNDSGMANDRVRSADIVSFNWSLTADSEESLGDSFTDVVLEQTIVMEPGAVVNFANRPAVCDAAKSSIVAQPSGTTIQGGTIPPAGTTSITLSCNLGSMGEDRAGIILPTSVQPMASSANGTHFTTTARAYAVDPQGTATAQPSEAVDSPPIEITAAPRYDVEKINGDAAGGYYGYQTINGVQVYGMYSYYTVQISTDRKVGVEAFQQPVTMEESFWAVRSVVGPNGEAVGTPITDLKWYLTQCVPTPAPRSGQVADGLVYGKIGTGSGAATAANSVRDSGACSIGARTAADTGSYELSMQGIDTSGVSYPTATLSGGSLAAGPFYVASYRVQIFIPMSEIDRTQGAPDDGVGEFSIYNRVGDFDPVGTSGASNFGSGFEPGYCDAGPTSDMATNCDEMEDGKRSNNVVGRHTKRIGPGSWGKYFSDITSGWAAGYGYINGTASHDGSALVQPGQAFTSIQQLNNTATPWASAQMCDVFDNTVLKLVPLNKDVSSSNPFPDGLYSAVLRATPSTSVADQQARQGDWIVKYGHVDLTGDDPNTGVFDTANNRWEGNWTNQYQATNGASTVCGSTAITWSDTPTDDTNVVWAQTAPGYTIDAGVSERWYLTFEQRDTYNGGTHAGEPVPAGTVAVNYGQVKTSGWNSNWGGAGYYPGAGDTAGRRTGENGSVQGDRWTVVRAQMRLQKRTIAGDVDGVPASGVADYGITGSAIAGKPVIWEITSTLTAIADPAAPVNNVTITDVLPKYVIFDEAGTAALNPGIPAPTVTANPDGTTTLVWNLGTRTPNQDLPVIKIATTTDTLAPNNTFVVNNANITASGIVPVSAHKDDHTIKLEQSGELQLKKSVDKNLDLQDDEQEYTLRLKNFGDTLGIQAPTIIDVLPYNGDATNSAGVNRNPPSDFTGQNTLKAAPEAFEFNGTTPLAGTFYYTTVAPASVPQNLNDDTNPAIWSTTFTANATAFKFVAAGPLSVATDALKSGLVIKFTTDQTGNSAGDFYSNRFTAFSDTLKNGQKYQLLTSNLVSVRVVGFSLGDLIWFDLNGDGKFTEGTDRVVPEGVKVEVYNEANTKVGETTTDEDGRWVVNKLPRGEYYAVIPASEFAAGGKLAGAIPSPINMVADPNTDADEDGDHHAIAGTGGAVRSSGLLELDADTDADPIQGLEPLGDNVKGLRLPPMTGDDFTNLTLDLALVPQAKFSVTKVVDGPGAAFGTGPFTIVVTCTFNGATVAGYPKTESFTAGQSKEFTAPFGSDCSASETGNGGATTVVVDPANGLTLDSEDGELEITVTNTFELGKLRLYKDVTGAGQEAGMTEGNVYKFDIVCSFNGKADAFKKSVEIVDDGSGQMYTDIEGIPVGAECTVTETDNGGADETPAPEIRVIVDKDTTVIFCLENVFSAGTVELAKVLTGDAKDDPFVLDLEFEVQVTCEVEVNDVRGVVYSDKHVIKGGQTLSLDDALLPAGTHCWLEETETQGADGVTLNYDGYDNAAIVAKVEKDAPLQKLELSASNRFDQAQITISKVVDGPDMGESYYFELSCTYPVDGQPVAYPLAEADAKFSLKGGEAKTITVLSGVSCEVVETDVPEGATVSITNSDGGTDGALADIEGDENAVEVTNTLELAELTVLKTVVGPGKSGASYDFELACIYHGSGGDVEYPLAPEDAKFSLKHGESKTITVLAGVDCVVKETNIPSGATVTIIDTDDSTEGGSTDGALNDLHGNENAVDVTNTFPPPSLPHTGGDTQILVWGAALLVMGLAVRGATTRRRKGERDHP